MSEFGTQLQRLLGERGMSTYRAARLVPCDPSYITHLCAGRKRPSRRIAERLDEILEACGALAALTPSPAARKPRKIPPPPALTAPPAGSWAIPVFEAVLSPADAARRAGEAGTRPAGLRDLRVAVSSALRASLASDYGQLARILPALIGHVELARFEPCGSDEADLDRLLSDIYAITGWTLIKADCPAAAWTAGQRALQLAEQAGDVLRSAAATRCLSEVHMRATSYEEATRTAFLAATYLDTAPTRNRAAVLCLRGGALLSACAAAARRGDSREAHTSLKAAAVCAGQLDEDRTDFGTVFGPTNVAIHRVAVAVELGDAREAVQHIPAVKFDRMPRQLTERRARFLIDAARGHAGLHDDQAALGALTEAEQVAPDELRNHRLTRQVVRDLLTRERRSSGLRALADRCQVLA